MIDWSFILLGFLQGVTEFLPVSSSGHLFVLESFLKNDNVNLSSILILHLATFLSVIVVFFKDIKAFLFHIQQKETFQLLLKVLTSLVPLVLTGFFFKSFVEQSFEKTTVALGFFSSGLLVFSLLFVRKKTLSLKEMSFIQAFFIGLAQTVAIFPGFSRSGWTIVAGLYCGLAPRTAVYYSFLISLPAILGSVIVDLSSVFFSQLEGEVVSSFSESWFNLSLSLAFLTAFFSGFLSLLGILKMVQYEKLYLFSFYLLPLSFFVFFFL